MIPGMGTKHWIKLYRLILGSMWLVVYLRRRSSPAAELGMTTRRWRLVSSRDMCLRLN